MKVLIACEKSQEVCKAFRARGHEAYSCDIQEPSGGHPEWHILGDALKALEGGQVVTMDGVTHDVGKWDLLIAHPPCTHLAVSGARWFTEGRKPLSLRFEAAAFFMKFAEADIPRIAIENPVCVMSTLYRKPDQIINPWQFGHPEQKKTCLWLKNLAILQETDNVYDYMMTLPQNCEKRIIGWEEATQKNAVKLILALQKQWLNSGGKQMKPKTKSELMTEWANQPDQLKKEREVKAVRKAMDDARAVMQDGLNRYVKKKTKARSMAKAEADPFAELEDWESMEQIQDAYGYGEITADRRDKLTDLWEAREAARNSRKGADKYHDLVTEMLETAIRRVGNEYADMLFEYDQQRREAEKQCEQLAMEGMMKK